MLEGRRALVTGAASGIGLACATKLGELGAAVVVADRDARGAAEVADNLHGEAWVVDLARSEALHTLHLEVAMLAVMLEAPFLLARAALPYMYQRGWGRIVNISSVHGLRASPFKSAYVAAKHGLEGLSKVLALEGAEHGVTSNTVCPGYVRTPLVEEQIASQARLNGVDEAEVVQTVLLRQSALKRLVEPEEVAAVVAYLCGPDAGFITGTSIVMDGGWTAR
jgi:3-hydroxybutyrate dehydrogenase